MINDNNNDERAENARVITSGIFKLLMRMFKRSPS